MPKAIIWNDETNNNTTINAVQPSISMIPVNLNINTSIPYIKAAVPNKSPNTEIARIGKNENETNEKSISNNGPHGYDDGVTSGTGIQSSEEHWEA